MKDPYGEFFVVEREDLKKENINEDYNDVYWEERFTLLNENLPSFIANFGEKILNSMFAVEVGRLMTCLKRVSPFFISLTFLLFEQK